MKLFLNVFCVNFVFHGYTQNIDFLGKGGSFKIKGISEKKNAL